MHRLLPATILPCFGSSLAQFFFASVHPHLRSFLLQFLSVPGPPKFSSSIYQFLPASAYRFLPAVVLPCFSSSLAQFLFASVPPRLQSIPASVPPCQFFSSSVPLGLISFLPPFLFASVPLLPQFHSASVHLYVSSILPQFLPASVLFCSVLLPLCLNSAPL